MSLDQSSIPGLGKGRLEALTDGIFATVMTVLVLSLSVPVIASNLTGSQLSSEVVTDIEVLWPNILGYVLSFLLLAVLWISHQAFFTMSQESIGHFSGSTPSSYSRSDFSHSQPL